MGDLTNFSIDTRTRILEAALLEFAKTGKDGTKIHAIVNRAGINVRKFYEVFESKETLYAEAIVYSLERIQTSLSQPTENEGIRAQLFRLESALESEPYAASLIRWEAAKGWNENLHLNAHKQLSHSEIRAAIESARNSGALTGYFDSDCLASYCILQLLLSFTGTLEKESPTNYSDDLGRVLGTKTDLLMAGLTAK